MTAEVHAIYPPEPDLGMAVDFLKTINPDGHQMLVAIRDGIRTAQAFGPGNWDLKRLQMQKWAAEKRNIYVVVNEIRAGATTNEKADIAFIRALYSDTDNKAVRQRALDATGDFTRSSHAAFVCDSGGGIHTFFLLDRPVEATPETITKAEDAGRGLRAYFHGDAVQDISRIMRVPGTVNWLDPKKRARGRSIGLSTVLAKTQSRVTLDGMLKDYPPPVAGVGGSPMVTSEDEKAALAEIDMSEVTAAGGVYPALPLGLRKRFEASKAFGSGLWSMGVTQPGLDQSGSGHVYLLAMMLHGDGFSGNEFGALADCWALVKPTNVEHRQLARAWAKTSKGAQARRVFGDPIDPEQVREATPSGKAGEAPQRAPIGAAGRIDPKTFPRREWLYGRRLIRGYMSSTIAAGGIGKSSLTLVEAVAMATGKGLLGPAPRAPLKVAIWNGEDPLEEMQRRLAGAMLHHGVTWADLGDRLFLVAGQDHPLRFGGNDHVADLKWLQGECARLGLDVLVIDPLVSSHRVPENDNMLMDMVAKTWSRLAKEQGMAIDLVHHIRKPPSGQMLDLSVDDARGASALVNASRNARVLQGMPEAVAVKLGVVNRKAYFCIQHDATKANMSPGATGVDWFHFAGVDLGNGDPFPAGGGPPIEGDNVGVVETWAAVGGVGSTTGEILSAQAEIVKGDWKKHSSANGWIGIPVAGALGLDPRVNKGLLVEIIDGWIKAGWLKTVMKLDGHRMLKEFVEVDKQPIENVF